ncbi:MAG: MFS transporter [Candidatus Lokiarchaeota archaeon]
MNKNNNLSTEREKVPLKNRILFATSAFPDQLTYQAFTIYIFTFYFAIVGLTAFEMWLAYVLWGAWNMLSNPLLGALSEKTKQKGRLGKRRFYLIIAFIPLALIMILMFTTPSNFKFWYFLFIIFAFEGFYAMFDVNTNAIFPEMFPTEKKRGDVNVFIKIFTLIAVILATIIPTMVMSFGSVVPTIAEGKPGYAAQLAGLHFKYILSGSIMAIIIAAMAIVFIFFGINEKEENINDFEKRPGFFESLKISFSNKTFLKFVFGNMGLWYCFNLLLTVFPLYSVYVLGRKSGAIFIGLTLMVALLAAAAFMPLQSYIRKKIGTRKGIILACGIWILTLFPLVLLSNNGISRELSFIIFATIGFGLSGALFFVDLIIGDVIDEDAIKFGVKRAASYYGVNGFINRFSVILSITTIFSMFEGTGWSSYTPIPTNPFLIQLGLKLLIFLFPAIALICSILFFKFFGLHGKRLEKMRAELQKHPELA